MTGWGSMARLTTHWLQHKTERHCIRQWHGEGSPKGVIHLLHGMMEHSGMVHDWAMALCEMGWDVVCNDQPGAGYTIHPECRRDHLPRHGVAILIESSQLVDDWIRAHYPNQKVIRYGHSMGSFLALNLEKNHVVADALILTGSTTEPQWLLRIQWSLIKIMGRLLGLNTPAALAHAIGISSLNRSFKMDGYEHAWVSRMPSVLRQYGDDPLCGNMASWGFYDALNHLLLEMNVMGDVQLPPILFITGEHDPLSKGGKKNEPLIRRLMPLSASVKHLVVPGARHKVECDEEMPMILAHIEEFLGQL